MDASATPSRNPQRPARNSPAAWTGFLIGPAFLLLAAYLLWGPTGVDIPPAKAAAIDRARLSTAPRRHTIGDPPVITIAGFQRTCMDCHRLFPPQPNPPVQLMQHRAIKLDHGINDRCRNCHYEPNRDQLVLHDGTPISYSNVVVLCAKCHGPTYRDWQHGEHGRTNGYWDRSRGEQRRLKCVECHDPHNPRVPAMDPLAPLPAPNTLRLVRTAEHPPREGVDSADPLRAAIHRALALDAAARAESRPGPPSQPVEEVRKP